MNSRELANKFLDAENRESASALLADAPDIPSIELAYALKRICYDSWAHEPTVAQTTSSALELLASIGNEPEICYIADWIKGISNITKGSLEEAIESLTKANHGFIELGKRHEAAQTQVAMLYPLGHLGEYQRAEEVGKNALEIFESLGDELAVGKIEMNLANIAERQGQHQRSKGFCLEARARFSALGETKWFLMAENVLAIALAELNEFEEAETRYRQALEIAKDEKMYLTQAEILASLGNLQTFRGQYGKAIKSLELSRKQYSELEMPHRSATADLEIAEIYQILNLTAEAFEIYERVIVELSQYGMKGEEARARANFGKLAMTTGDLGRSAEELDLASDLFIQEGNSGGAASVNLLQARLLSVSGEPGMAIEKIESASVLIENGEFPRLKIETRYFRAEMLRKTGRIEEAASALAEVIIDAKLAEQLEMVSNCYVSLAKIFILEGRLDEAELNLNEAIRAVERLRDPIPAEEFRMAFLADKLAPFILSAKVSLEKNDIDSAFAFTERARSRTLFERLNNNGKQKSESAGNRDYELLREKLNWNYSRLARDAGVDNSLMDEIAEIEKKLAEIVLVDSSVLEQERQLDIDVDWFALPVELKRQLGPGRVMIEYYLDGPCISAFVVDDKGIDHFEAVTTEDEISALIEGLRFQFESMRFESVSDFEAQLRERSDLYLEALYEELLAPFADHIGTKDLVIIPVGQLLYVPFNALFDGKEYAIESRSIAIAPSAAVWSKLPSGEIASNGKTLIVAYSDEKSPVIDVEASLVGEILGNAQSFSGTDATLENYFECAAGANIIHLACHGAFRADSPLYSNLRLADGFLTVRDIAAQSINADLVTLSACETGLNEVFAGEEILGLARGFLGAGAARLVMSLWTVNDESTSVLMKHFYGSLVSGETAPNSLRIAQKVLINEGKHPYYWAPFVIIGK